MRRVEPPSTQMPQRRTRASGSALDVGQWRTASRRRERDRGVERGGVGRDGDDARDHARTLHHLPRHPARRAGLQPREAPTDGCAGSRRPWTVRLPRLAAVASDRRCTGWRCVSVPRHAFSVGVAGSPSSRRSRSPRRALACRARRPARPRSSRATPRTSPMRTAARPRRAVSCRTRPTCRRWSRPASQINTAQALEQAATPTRPALTPGELFPGWNGATRCGLRGRGSAAGCTGCRGRTATAR